MIKNGHICRLLKVFKSSLSRLRSQRLHLFSPLSSNLSHEELKLVKLHEVFQQLQPIRLHSRSSAPHIWEASYKNAEDDDGKGFYKTSLLMFCSDQ